MAWGSGLVDMELDDESKLDLAMPMPMMEKPDYPPGLKICLTREQLTKLGLDCDCEIGDSIEFGVEAEVTNVNKGKDDDRVELQITKMAVEPGG